MVVLKDTRTSAAARAIASADASVAAEAGAARLPRDHIDTFPYAIYRLFVFVYIIEV